MENRRLKQTAYSFLIFILLCFQTLLAAQDVMYSKEVQVGVILDMDLGEGKAIYRCITMAISDFYEANPHYRTRIVLETRDTKGEPLSSAVDLLENAKVEAIIGPDSTGEARFLEVLKDKTNVPFVSFSTSPFLDHNPYLLRIAQDEFRGIFLGGTTNRRRLQMNRKKLRILVPLFGGFPNLVQMAIDPRTNLPTVSGYCGDVFRAAFNALNYGVDVEYIPLEDGRTYNDLIDKVYNKEFDAAIGDITIMTNRTRYVDFTLPISELGIGTLVRNEKKSMWIFLNPLSADLWFTFTAFFLVLGFVIWFTEHRINKEFQGSTNEQIGKTLWFAFSTLVYAHREKLQSNLSRFVVTVWVFVVLVLSSSYTATLSSLLTVQQIASKGGLVQFQGNSPVGESIFNNLKSSDGIIEPLPLPEDYAKALRSGKVGAIIDEIFYIKTVIGMYSADEFSLVAASSTTNGFAFAFQKDSPMTKDLSSEIAKLRADGTLKALEDKWLKRQFSIMSKDLSAPSPTILNLHRFRGLFLISGVSMALAFLMSVVYLVREKCHGRSKIEILRCIFPTSVQVHALDNVFHPAV